MVIIKLTSSTRYVSGIEGSSSRLRSISPSLTVNCCAWNLQWKQTVFTILLMLFVFFWWHFNSHLKGNFFVVFSTFQLSRGYIIHTDMTRRDVLGFKIFCHSLFCRLPPFSLLEIQIQMRTYLFSWVFTYGLCLVSLVQWAAVSTYRVPMRDPPHQNSVLLVPCKNMAAIQGHRPGRDSWPPTTRNFGTSGRPQPKKGEDRIINEYTTPVRQIIIFTMQTGEEHVISLQDVLSRKILVSN